MYVVRRSTCHGEIGDGTACARTQKINSYLMHNKEVR